MTLPFFFSLKLIPCSLVQRQENGVFQTEWYISCIQLILVLDTYNHKENKNLAFFVAV